MSGPVLPSLSFQAGLPHKAVVRGKMGGEREWGKEMTTPPAVDLSISFCPSGWSTLQGAREKEATNQPSFWPHVEGDFLVQFQVSP